MPLLNKNSNAEKKNNMKELRCSTCNKLLFYFDIFNGKIEIQCPRCKALNNVVK